MLWREGSGVPGWKSDLVFDNIVEQVRGMSSRTRGSGAQKEERIMIMEQQYINLSSEQLRAYLDSHDEEEYVLVDVRQPEEYRRGHIPGARLLPLAELGARLPELPTDRDIIFY